MYIYTYILLSPDAERPPSRCIAHTGPGTGSRISARFLAPGHEPPRARWGGAPRAGGRSLRPSGDVCAEPLHLEGSPETRGVPSSGAGPSKNCECSGSGICRKIRAWRSAVNCVRSGRIRICVTPVSLHDMYYIYMSVLGLAEDMEARVLRSSPQAKGPSNTPRAKARPAQDGRPSLGRQRGWDGGCRANRFRRKTRDVFMN